VIGRSLLTAVLLLIGYQAVLPYFPPHLGLQQWGQHANIRVAQTFLYSPAKATRNVVVGTSLAQTMENQSLGPDYYNLAFGGGSSLAGLEVLRRSGATPALVLVEMNYFYQSADKEFTGDLFSPLSPLRRYLPMFREANRPANFVAGLTLALINQGRSTLNWIQGRMPVGERAEPAGPGATVQKIAPEVLAVRIRDYEHALSDKALNDAADRLVSELTALSARGCRCVLFEMPVDPALMDAASARAVRRVALQRFPPHLYGWIPVDRAHSYVTRDGTHLLPSSAQEYARFLARQLKDGAFAGSD
jgi:hypothetical protein